MLNFRSLNFALGEDIDMLRATVQQFAHDEGGMRACRSASRILQYVVTGLPAAMPLAP